MKGVRVTNHNARAGKNGVFSPKHNDRNFNLKHAEHIDATKNKFNKYWFFCDEISEQSSFEEYELSYYNKHFTAALNDKNKNPIKNRQYGRVMDMKQYYSSKNFCPEETIFQVGSFKDSEKADAEKLTKIFNDYCDWHNQNYPQAVLLDAALHVDEPNAAPHVHFRKVWLAHKNGYEYVNQNASLNEMGVERIFKNKAAGRYNNPKMTYTEKCREKLIEICKSYGMEIIEKPKNASKSGLEKEKFEKQQLEKKIEELRAQIEALQEIIMTQTDIVNKFKYERKGFFGKKTGNIVISVEEYNMLILARDTLCQKFQEMINNAVATTEYKNAIVENLAETNLSRMRFQQELDARAEEKYRNEHRDLINEKEKIKKVHEQSLKILAEEKQKAGKINAYIAKALKSLDSGVVKFLESHCLDDGRNAYTAFHDYCTKAVGERLARTVASNEAELQLEIRQNEDFSGRQLE